MYNNFFNEVKQFTTLIDTQRSQGKKMKDIAGYLDILPSVLSGLYKTVFPYILANEDGDEETIKHAFKLVNNVSKDKIIARLPLLCQRLEAYNSIPTESHFENWIADYLKYYIQHPNNDKHKNLKGLYEIQILDKNRQIIQKEPFLIKSSKDGNYLIARKGNHQSKLMMKGFVSISKNHTITIQLLNDSKEYQFFETYYLSQTKHGNLKGLVVSLIQGADLSCRRMMLKKVSNSTTYEHFEDMKNSEISTSEFKAVEGQEVLSYLQESNEVSSSSFDISKIVSSEQ